MSFDQQRNKDQEDMITYKEVYDNLWRCRDFELKHSWQRSIFLTAFLVACCAGYGQVILSICDSDKSVQVTGNLVLNGCAFLLTLVGIVLSVLWIQMGKASKAWYECYEKAIVAFSDQKEYFENEKVSEISGFKYRDIPGYESDRISNWLWSTTGGGYSPSRINIAIGHLSFLIWSIAAVVHLMIAAGCDSDLKNLFVNPAYMGLLFVFVLLGIWVYSLICLKSRWLNESDSQKAGHFAE